MARVYVGAFPTAIVQRRPASAAIVEIGTRRKPHPYRLEGVPEGNWFIHAVGVADSADPEPWTRRALVMGEHARVPVRAGTGARAIIPLRSRRPTDLPILLALPDLELHLSDALVAVTATTPPEFAAPSDPALTARVSR
jgi:hypothetical protein